MRSRVNANNALKRKYRHTRKLQIEYIADRKVYIILLFFQRFRDGAFLTPVVKHFRNKGIFLSIRVPILL